MKTALPLILALTLPGLAQAGGFGAQLPGPGPASAEPVPMPEPKEIPPEAAMTQAEISEDQAEQRDEEKRPARTALAGADTASRAPEHLVNGGQPRRGERLVERMLYGAGVK